MIRRRRGPPSGSTNDSCCYSDVGPGLGINRFVVLRPVSTSSTAWRSLRARHGLRRDRLGHVRSTTKSRRSTRVERMLAVMSLIGRRSGKVVGGRAGNWSRRRDTEGGWKLVR